MSLALHFLSFLLGLAILYFANVQYRKVVMLLASGQRTRATVVEIITEESDDGGYVYRPRFKFTDRKNTQVTFDSQVSSSIISWKIGELAEVVYNPANTSEVHLVTFWSLYRSVTWLTILASPFLIIGAGYFAYRFNLL